MIDLDHRVELWIVEQAELGTDHTEVANELLQKWSFPSILRCSIAAHHQPDRMDGGDPVEYRIKGTAISMRRSDASTVLVGEVTDD